MDGLTYDEQMVVSGQDPSDMADDVEREDLERADRLAEYAPVGEAWPWAI